MAEKDDTGRRSNPAGKRGALERMYAYWLSSTVVFLLALIALMVYVGGALQRQGTQLGAATEQATVVAGDVAQLQDRLAAVERRLDALAAQVSSLAAREPAPTPETPPTAPAAPAVPAEPTVRAQLFQSTSPNPSTPFDIARPAEAAAAIATATRHLDEARWGGETWLRLAIVARLLSDDRQADAFAERAAAQNQDLLPYIEAATRCAVARGRNEEAASRAAQLAEHAAASSSAAALLAAAHHINGNAAAADEALAQVTAPRALPSYDLLLLTRVAMELQRWDRLVELLNAAGDVPAPLDPAFRFVHAVALSQAAQSEDGHVKALAALDYVKAHLDDPLPSTPVSTDDWRTFGPDAYEVDVWRGMALVAANQMTAAREILESAVAAEPQRAAAHYALGEWALRMNELDMAAEQLEQAVALAPDHAPAWEALAVTELTRNQLEAAVRHARRATELHPRRPSAHFLLALAHANLVNRDEAAVALRTAFQLDPRYREEAEHAEVFTRLFTAADLEALAQGAEPADLSVPAER